jgi:hypothetical protein
VSIVLEGSPVGNTFAEEAADRCRIAAWAESQRGQFIAELDRVIAEALGDCEAIDHRCACVSREAA